MNLFTRHPVSPYWAVIGVWLFLRILTSAWVAWISPMHPATPEEQAIPLWPPTSPGSAWVERLLLSPWLRWDARWYVKIVENGYHAGDGTAAFHPLYPWLAALLAHMGVPTVAGLLLISSVAGLCFLMTFTHLARSELNDEQAFTSTLLLVCFPLACVLFAPYTEALFLWMASLCLWWSRQRAWWKAGLAGFLAALTRQQGLFLILPIAWEWWESGERRIERNWQTVSSLFALSLPAGGMLFWMLYRNFALGDFSPDFSNLHTLIYSILITPSATKIIAFHTFTWPWVPLGVALQKLWMAPDMDLLINLVMAACLIILLLLSWRYLRPGYRLYCVLIFLVSFSFYTGPPHPYLGLARHLLLAFPVFLPLGRIIRGPLQRTLLAAFGLLGGLFLLMEHTLEVWVM